MENIIKQTRILGEEIQKSEKYIAYRLASEKNNEDKELQDLIGEFNLKRMSIQEFAEKEEKDRDEEKLKNLNSEMRAIYANIMKNENMTAYNNAKAELDKVINNINSIISLCLDGADPATCEPKAAGCGSGCNSCSGCN